jgi:hypothetical protein
MSRRPGSTLLHLLESVRCLECGETYLKPATGGAIDENPGCPSCGYVGWLPVTRPSGRRRFAEDLRRHHRVQSG